MNIDEIMTHPAVTDFLDTWAVHCGAPRKVFTGHVRAMLGELLDSAAGTLPARITLGGVCGCPAAQWGKSNPRTALAG